MMDSIYHAPDRFKVFFKITVAAVFQVALRTGLIPYKTIDK